MDETLFGLLLRSSVTYHLDVIMSRFLESVIFEQPAAHVSIAGVRLETELRRVANRGGHHFGLVSKPISSGAMLVETRMVIRLHISDLSATVLS